VEWAGLVLWMGGPLDGSFGFCQKEHSNARPMEKKIQRESLGTDMLQERKNGNYIRYHIELINRFCGGWFVFNLLIKR